MGTLIRDIQHGLRLLMKQPGFTLAALAVLALGIGANTAIFSLVNAFLLKPLVIKHAEELMGAYSRDSKKPDSYRAFSYAAYAELRDRNTVFSSLMAHNMAMVGLSEGDTTRRIFVDMIGSNYFSTLGVPLFQGRTFTADEERPGSAVPVVIASYPYWKKNGSDPALLGKTLRVNGKIYTIVGIAPEGFTGTTALVSPELYLPLGMFESLQNDFEGTVRPLAAADNYTLILVGRLRAGMTQQAADAQLAAGAAYTDTRDKDRTVIVRPLARLGISDAPMSDSELRIPSILLLSMAGVILLIASLNVANMMLARGTARRKEIAIRVALGAGRAAIVRQLFTEGLLLALLGGAAGLAVAYWSTRLLIGSLGSLIPFDLVYSASPDLSVLAATMGFCLLSTLFFSFGPAWNLSKPDVFNDLKGKDNDSATSSLRGLFSLRNLLVMGQLSLSLMLLTAAGLFIRSSLSAANVDPGFRIENNILAEVDPSLAGYDETRGKEIYRTLLGRLRAVPGVEAADIAATVPFGMISLGRSIERATDSKSGNNMVGSSFNIVGPDYFKVMGVGLLRGRVFLENENKARPVVIISKMAADKLWPGSDPLGQHIRMTPDGANQTPRDAEVVGVVASVQERIIGQSLQPQIYVPFGQEYQSDMTIHLRTSGSNAGRVMETVRREILAVDSRLTVLTLRTLRDHLDSSFDVWIVRTAARMFTIFGMVALLLASIGLYGVRAYSVARRTREIGIRMAIGASAGDALGMVLREGLALTAIGLGAGLALSLALGKVLAGLLYQVSGVDPFVFTAAPLLLAAVSLLACYFPARRASRVDPMVALRYE